MTGKYLNSYINKYAEPEAQQLEGLSDKYQRCICIPAYNEPAAFIYRLINFINKQTNTLAIIVLNRPDNIQAACDSSDSDNHKCKQVLTQNLSIAWQRDNIQLHSAQNKSAILLVDRFDIGAAITAKQGVGMARKIAADIALQLINQQQISEPWIYSTDADVILPDNYFDRSQSPLNLNKNKKKNHAQTTSSNITDDNIAAYILAYQHIATGNQAIDKATRLYEHRLNAYVNGLNLAKSPYAFQTLGSTLCVNAKHYAMVRGFPKRAAGEDFYLLNKLRKTGAIVSLKTPTIEIESRISHRTPFGTGTSVDNILANDNPEQAAIFYHPQLFILLQKTLTWLAQLSGTSFIKNDFIKKEMSAWQQAIKNSHEWSIEEQERIISALTAIDFNSGLTHSLNNSKDAVQFKRQMEAWFDGFKTLKYLHALRDDRFSENQLSGKQPFNNVSEQRYLELLTELVTEPLKETSPALKKLHLKI